jgi:hypothetical protein
MQFHSAIGHTLLRRFVDLIETLFDSTLSSRPPSGFGETVGRNGPNRNTKKPMDDEIDDEKCLLKEARTTVPSRLILLFLQCGKTIVSPGFWQDFSALNVFGET